MTANTAAGLPEGDKGGDTSDYDMLVARIAACRKAAADAQHMYARGRTPYQTAMLAEAWRLEDEAAALRVARGMVPNATAAAPAFDTDAAAGGAECAERGTRANATPGPGRATP